MSNKTHFRKVYKSDHLGVADLEDYLEIGKPLVFKLKQVKQELNIKVAGKNGDFNVAYFDEKIKPLVLNVTNSNVIKSFFPTKEHPKGSPFVEDWKNINIELYIDSTVKMKGDVVGGVRILNRIPVLSNDIIDKLKECDALDKLNSLYSTLSKEQKTIYNKDFTAKKQQINANN
jgi:hypothetical protein